MPQSYPSQDADSESAPLLERPRRIRRRFNWIKEIASSTWSDFKEFAFQGNIVDLAVGVIMGSAFSGIVSSVVSDILSPFLSLWVGSQLQNAFYILKEPNKDLCDQAAINNPATLMLHYAHFFLTNITSLVQSPSSFHPLFSTSDTPDPNTPPTPVDPCAYFPTPAAAQAYGAITVNYGKTLQLTLNFLTQSLILFVFLRIFAVFKRQFKVSKKKKEAEAKEEAERKKGEEMMRCSYCLGDVRVGAVRCMHCTSTLEPVEVGPGGGVGNVVIQ
ncbi:hypothetical protein HDV05_006054 [Chytridiales sp. JEL 0842]|nr:hypothetical protein HDV05_006054 [Chytridiales sp. JEL 0842]